MTHVLDEVHVDVREPVGASERSARIRLRAGRSRHRRRLLHPPKAVVEQSVVDQVIDHRPVREEPSGHDGGHHCVPLALNDEQRDVPGAVTHLRPRLAGGALRRRGVGVTGIHLV